jgi:hypothetical protein
MVEQAWDKSASGGLPGIAISNTAGTADQSSLTQDEKEKLEEELRDKNIQKLMELNRTRQQEAEQADRVLHSVKSGDMTALIPYITHTERPKVAIRAEDDERANAIIADKHLRNERYTVEVKSGEDPTRKLERQKQWLKYLLPDLQTDAVLIKGEDGKTFVGVLGVSNDEVAAAFKVRQQLDRTKEESAIIERHIQEKVGGEMQKRAPSPDDQQVRAPATPAEGRQESLVGR